MTAASPGAGAPPAWLDIVGNARVVALPLLVPFRGVTVREAVLIEGPAGWGEFAPFDDYCAAEASWWLDSALESAYLPPPPPVRAFVPVNAIIPGVAAVQARDLADAATAAGYRTVKVKVGGDLTADVARIRAVRSVFAGDIRVDANGAWTVSEAVAALTELDAAAGGLAYAEQPCPEVADLAALRRLVTIPIAADESIRRADDPLTAARHAAADVLVVKVAPLGGIRRAMRVVAQAQVPIVVSSALDTSVGLSAGLALAAAVPQLAGDCGLGTGDLFADDVVTHCLRPRGGRLPTDYRPVIDTDALQRAQQRVPAARRDYWMARLADAWHNGTSHRLDQLLADSGL